MLSSSSAHAEAPALFLWGKVLRVDLHTCLEMARSATALAGVNLDPVHDTPIGIAGTTPTTRVFTVCVQRPRDGICGGEGTTPFATAAGNDGLALVQKIIANMIPPKLSCL